MPIQNPRLREAFGLLRAEWDAMFQVTKAAAAWVSECKKRGEKVTVPKKLEDAIVEGVAKWEKLQEGK